MNFFLFWKSNKETLYWNLFLIVNFNFLYPDLMPRFSLFQIDLVIYIVSLFYI